jgi:hypothetical protein
MGVGLLLLQRLPANEPIRRKNDFNTMIPFCMNHRRYDDNLKQKSQDVFMFEVWAADSKRLRLTMFLDFRRDGANLLAL